MHLDARLTLVRGLTQNHSTSLRDSSHYAVNMMILACLEIINCSQRNDGPKEDPQQSLTEETPIDAVAAISFGKSFSSWSARKQIITGCFVGSVYWQISSVVAKATVVVAKIAKGRKGWNGMMEKGCATGVRSGNCWYRRKRWSRALVGNEMLKGKTRVSAWNRLLHRFLIALETKQQCLQRESEMSFVSHLERNWATAMEYLNWRASRKTLKPYSTNRRSHSLIYRLPLKLPIKV